VFRAVHAAAAVDCPRVVSDCRGCVRQSGRKG
jgi:hypothetical protein